VHLTNLTPKKGTESEESETLKKENWNKLELKKRKLIQPVTSMIQGGVIWATIIDYSIFFQT
jgi:hypothetical protein